MDEVQKAARDLKEWYIHDIHELQTKIDNIESLLKNPDIPLNSKLHKDLIDFSKLRKEKLKRLVSEYEEL